MLSAYSNNIQKEKETGWFLETGMFILLMIITPYAFGQVEMPYAGSGTAFMHDDALSSDVFEGKAPSGDVNIEFETKMGAVPTILQGSPLLLPIAYICLMSPIVSPKLPGAQNTTGVVG